MTTISAIILLLIFATSVVIVLYKILDVIGATLLALPLGYFAGILAFITGGIIFCVLLGTIVVFVFPYSSVGRNLQIVEYRLERWPPK